MARYKRAGKPNHFQKRFNANLLLWGIVLGAGLDAAFWFLGLGRSEEDFFLLVIITVSQLR